MCKGKKIRGWIRIAGKVGVKRWDEEILELRLRVWCPAEFRRDWNRTFGDLEFAIFRKTEKGQCGSLYRGDFVAWGSRIRTDL
jgi:hypothetical protein